MDTTILAVSDIHLREDWMCQLSDIVVNEKPDILIISGDICDILKYEMIDPNRQVMMVYQWLESLEIEVHIASGNHDNGLIVPLNCHLDIMKNHNGIPIISIPWEWDELEADIIKILHSSKGWILNCHSLEDKRVHQLLKYHPTLVFCGHTHDGPWSKKINGTSYFNASCSMDDEGRDVPYYLLKIQTNNLTLIDLKTS